nr:hypothetical protein [Tanacetum cinerariifolium]
MDTDNEGFREECGEDCSGNNEKFNVTKEDCGSIDVQNIMENDVFGNIGLVYDVNATKSGKRSEMHNEDGKGKHGADSIMNRKNKQKHDVMDTDNEGFREECGKDCSGNNEKFDVTKEDCGVTEEQGLGRPIMMDNVTGTMCHKGIGSTWYAIILVEIDAKKGFVDQIEVIYKDYVKETKRIKLIKVKPKVVDNKGNLHNKDKSNDAEVDKNDKKKVDNARSNNSPPSLEKIWNVSPKNIKKIIISENTYIVLSKELDKEDTGDDCCKDSRPIVDRSSGNTMDMVEFNEVVNNIEMEDIRSCGFQFTWTKSLRNPQCCYMYKLVKNLKKLKKPLKKLSWKNENVKFLKEKLKLSQDAIDKKPRDEKLREEVVKTLNAYVEAYNDEIKILQQKFLGKKDQVKPVNAEIFKNTLTKEEAFFMIRDVTDKEIKESVFDIDGDKASRQDGSSYVFFKNTWGIVGNEVCLAIKEFFRNDKLLREVNSTLIALIPKVSIPTKVSEFRPIACNERKTSVCYDKWCKDGLLSSAMSKRDIYDARLQDEAKVADIISQWIWPDGWINKAYKMGKHDKLHDVVKEMAGYGNEKCIDSLIHHLFQCDMPRKIWNELVNKAYKMGKHDKLHDVVNEMAGYSNEKCIGMVINKLIFSFYNLRHLARKESKIV